VSWMGKSIPWRMINAWHAKDLDRDMGVLTWGTKRSSQSETTDVIYCLAIDNRWCEDRLFHYWVAAK